MDLRLFAVAVLFMASGVAHSQSSHHGGHGSPPEPDQKQGEQLFENFLRWGSLPLEIKVNMYRTSTSTTNVGPFIGTIVAKNTKVKVGHREEDALSLKAKLFSLTPGPHAFHLHEYPDCRAQDKDGQMVPGLAAGGHLYVEGYHEGSRRVYKSHLGDLPNLIVAGDGTTSEEIVVPRLTLGDLLNRSIMIHASQDDNSGREACGVFK